MTEPIVLYDFWFHAVSSRWSNSRYPRLAMYGVLYRPINMRSFSLIIIMNTVLIDSVDYLAILKPMYPAVVIFVVLLSCLLWGTWLLSPIDFKPIVSDLDFIQNE